VTLMISITFPTYRILARPAFFPKMLLRFSDFIFWNGVFLCYRVLHDVSGLHNPETP